MNEPVTIIVMGEPVGKGRPRAYKMRSGHIGTYTPEKTRNYEGYMKWCASDAMRDRPRFEEAVSMTVTAEMGIPESWSGKKQRMAESGEIKPAKKPDIDNLLKAILDSCNSIIYADDAQVCEIIARKLYSRTPRLVIEVRQIEFAQPASHVD